MDSEQKYQLLFNKGKINLKELQKKLREIAQRRHNKEERKFSVKNPFKNKTSKIM